MNRSVIRTLQVALIVLTFCSGCSASEYANDDYPKCTDNDYIAYKPVFGNNKGGPGSELYIIDESRVDAGHYDRIKLIFEFYKVNYRVVDGKVWVDCNVWANKDYMMNMTTKADKNSVAEHCALIRRDFDNPNLNRDIYGNTPKMLEMCDSMGM